MELSIDDKALYLAILRQNPGAPRWRDLRDLLEATNRVEALLEIGSSSGLDGFSEVPLKAARPAHYQVREALAELKLLGERGSRLVTTICDDYPANLRTTFDRPPFLFCRGQVTQNPKLVAVVGSREASPEGLEYARRLSIHLVENGYGVVSGLAAGVDTAAHIATLEAGGETMAIIGTGINRHYPKPNRELQERIASEGAVLSQFMPDDPPRQQNFPMRNLVMSGTALATVVVEATEKSGTKSQAKGALKHGRLVFFTEFALAKAEWARKMVGQPGVFVVKQADDLYNILETALVDEPEAELEQLSFEF